MPVDSSLSLRGRIGAYRLHATHDPVETTRAARAAASASLDARLLSEIDADGSLSESERARRLQAARQAHYARLAYLSAVKRSRKAASDAA